jgi:hypothetical protein
MSIRQDVRETIARRKAEAAVPDLIKALAPFATEADCWDDSVPSDYRPHLTEPEQQAPSKLAIAQFTVGDLRAARDLYRSLEAA